MDVDNRNGSVIFTNAYNSVRYIGNISKYLRYFNTSPVGTASVDCLKK